ncbi:OmpA family protein [Sphingobium sp. AP49]|uniref:OmpA family protein n=1 Tax=Sphingobium sp. AP49 TaxID=1144307 RepID=UPI00026EE534|nr:OmpA family protein [Sphingobium sp. AP49]WHO40175.1 OmpA family protein [Sphingobium sp. AP49]
MQKLLSILAVLLLAACQTVQPSDGFTEPQKAVLRANGFQQVGTNWEFGMADRLLFATDQSVLISAQRDVISRISSALVAVDVHGAKVEGHTDNTGASAYNEQLSQKRAQAVADALAAGGMAPAALRPVGMGERVPVASNDTEVGRQENRRVVIIVAPSDAMPL